MRFTCLQHVCDVCTFDEHDLYCVGAKLPVFFYYSILAISITCGYENLNDSLEIVYFY